MIAIIDYDAGNIKSVEKAFVTSGKKTMSQVIPREDSK